MGRPAGAVLGRTALSAAAVGAVGLVLPQATGIAGILTPIAATGLAIVTIIAARVHQRRGETGSLPVNAVLFLLAAVVAVGRFAG